MLYTYYVPSTGLGRIATREVLTYLTDEAMEGHRLESLAEAYTPNMRCDQNITVNAAAKCRPTEKQGSSIREAACRNLVTVCEKFQLVQGSQLGVSYG